MAYIFCFHAGDIKLLMERTTALAAKDCDDLFDIGFRTDGTYVMNIVGKILPMFCEFERGGYNWLVSKQGILLYEVEMTFFKLTIRKENYIERKNFFTTARRNFKSTLPLLSIDHCYRKNIPVNSRF